MILILIGILSLIIVPKIPSSKIPDVLLARELVAILRLQQVHAIYNPLGQHAVLIDKKGRTLIKEIDQRTLGLTQQSVVLKRLEPQQRIRLFDRIEPTFRVEFTHEGELSRQTRELCAGKNQPITVSDTCPQPKGRHFCMLRIGKQSIYIEPEGRIYAC